MRIAIITDIHANLQALDACLADAEGRGAERCIFLGDMIGYGGDPEGVMLRVGAMLAAGAVALRGNHEEGLLDGGLRMSSAAGEAIRWTRDRLSPADVAFLAALPLCHAEGDLFFCHANAADPGGWAYLTDGQAAGESLAAVPQRLLFCGHIHRPAFYRQAPGRAVAAVPFAAGQPVGLAAGRWLCVVPACGQPRDGDPAAGYALLDTARDELTACRVPYDVATAAARIRAAGLPEMLAERLFAGW